jgi:hypothetical protein
LCDLEQFFREFDIIETGLHGRGKAVINFAPFRRQKKRLVESLRRLRQIAQSQCLPAAQGRFFKSLFARSDRLNYTTDKSFIHRAHRRSLFNKAKKRLLVDRRGIDLLGDL